MISGVVFLDLKKAFDTVDHSLLLTKLEHVGVRGHSLEWFNSYLTNRYQFVYINGILSEQDMIKCGVPQGSILGPRLFLIYINDLSNITDFDTNMTFTACSVEGLRHEMNADIEKLKQWLCVHKLTLNILKTEYMLIDSRQRIATVTETLDLSINGISLKKVNCSKCLGVELDEFLSWDSHITSVCKKVSSGIGVIKKDQAFYSIAQFN